MAYIEANPTATSKEIADATGAHRSYVSALFVREGVSHLRRMPVAYNELRAAMRRQPDLIGWLRETRPSDVDMGSYVVSLLVDAMLDDKEKGDA